MDFKKLILQNLQSTKSPEVEENTPRYFTRSKRKKDEGITIDSITNGINQQNRTVFFDPKLYNLCNILVSNDLKKTSMELGAWVEHLKQNLDNSPFTTDEEQIITAIMKNILKNLKMCKTKNEALEYLDSNILHRKGLLTTKRKRVCKQKKHYELTEKFEKYLDQGVMDEMEYFVNKNKKQKRTILKKMEKVSAHVTTKPLMFRLLDTSMTVDNRAAAMSRLNQLRDMQDTEGGDYYKLNSWFESLLSVPFGKSINENIDLKTSKEISNFLLEAEQKLDKCIYGQKEAKREIMHILAQKISNPSSHGNVFSLWGPPGIGKTSLIQQGLSKIMKRPYAFISLGGKTDSSTLVGHSYTYEGSQPGAIVQILQKSGCMNPVIFFDELDKISKSPKGDEIKNVLMHLTDPVQNMKFHDEYFSGIDFDLSQATFVFSYNDPELVDPILLDRITAIRMNGFQTPDKVKIAQEYLIPDIVKNMGFKEGSIRLHSDTVQHLIQQYTIEGGVRKLKELLSSMIMELNLLRLTEEKKIEFPYLIKSQDINHLLMERIPITTMVSHSIPVVGKINGLFATQNGTGGLIPIEASFFPSTTKLDLLLTGMQGKVMQESMKVAKTLAWSMITNEEKKKYLKKWNRNSNEGIHVHAPEGAVPKDGPSAGTAITVAIISLLTQRKISNEVAITGEIDLNGNVREIGGLEDKLYGAKNSGVKKVLIPRENNKNLDKIIKKNKNLLDKNFQVKMIDTIDDAIKETLL